MKHTLFTLLTLSFFNLALATGDGASNGGWIDAMILADINDRATLSVSDIEQIVRRNGRDVKNRLLKPFFIGFLSSEENLGETINAIREGMQSHGQEVLTDIDESPIRIGNCSANQTLCTNTENYSDITIDTQQVLSSQFGITFSELIGMIAHEYSHHFVGQADHPSYAFARYVRDQVRSQRVGQRTFQLNDLIRSCVFENNRSYGYNRCLMGAFRHSSFIRDRAGRRNRERGQTYNQQQANSFCQKEGYARASSYVTDHVTYGFAKSLDVDINEQHGIAYYQVIQNFQNGHDFIYYFQNRRTQGNENNMAFFQITCTY